MISAGRRLYERYRKHEPDSLHWNYLQQDDRDFWERLSLVFA